MNTWKERDKLTSAFLLDNPGPGAELSSKVFAEAAATYLCLPSRVCKDRVGEKIGKSTVDRHGERVILEALPGGHWTERHDTLAKEVSALCNYAGIVSEREPFGLFGHLVPQSALSRLQQNQSSQVLRPDLRMELPKRKTRPPDRGRQDDRQAQPAQVSTSVWGLTIAEIKVISKGVKAHYIAGQDRQRAVDKRASTIPAEYKTKVLKMDREIMQGTLKAHARGGWRNLDY